MDVHRPKAALSWREFAVEIGTVTIGILIALSLEALVEASRTHALVDHARADLQAELTGDRQAIADMVKSAESADRGATVLTDMMERKLKGEAPPPIKNMAVGMDFQTLNQGAWESTVATQALAHMPFAEARALSEAYGDVRSFNDFERDATRQWFEIFALPLGEDVDKSQLRDEIAKLKLSQAYVRGIRQSGAQTLVSIDKALAAIGRRAPVGAARGASPTQP